MILGASVKHGCPRFLRLFLAPADDLLRPDYISVTYGRNLPPGNEISTDCGKCLGAGSNFTRAAVTRTGTGRSHLGERMATPFATAMPGLSSAGRSSLSFSTRRSVPPSPPNGVTGAGACGPRIFREAA